MQNISTYCTLENRHYEMLHYSAFEVKNLEEGAKDMDIRKYELPLPNEKLVSLIQKDPSYKKPENLSNFYTNLAKGISNDYKIAQLLEMSEVRSTIRYLGHTQEKSPNGATNIYLITETLTPLNIMGFTSKFTIGCVVDMARRLFGICRDMDKVGVTHRNITPYCIFFTPEDRLVLGGFESAATSGINKKPEVAPLYPCHVAPNVAAGEKGNLASDMYSIASIMGCFFSGEDICKSFSGNISNRLPLPIQETLRYGLSNDPANLVAFWKSLNNIYKVAKREGYWDMPISFLYQMRLSAGTEEEKEAPETEAEPVAEPKHNKPGKFLSFVLGAATMTAILFYIMSTYGVASFPI